ncbi:MAG TPA: site-2 protease family protein [Thermoanaerobaculia bacterium]|nr:site-2 protease family protein [Thermoanaerobaculia bacterium]
MSYLGVLVLLSLLIVIHEAGHLLAARWMGIPIAGFSVGFGPKLWSRRWGRVEYSLRWFPLGGFVLPAMDELEFSSISLRKRLVYFLGGPLANLTAALPLFAVLNATEKGLSIYQLFVAPFGQTAAVCRKILGLLPGMLSPDSIMGVIGIVVEGGRAGAGMGLYIAISLSLSLAVLNLLPIPILDGGQIVMSCLEEAFPRFVRLRVPLTLLGLIFLAAVTVYANALDVVRYLS